jgi:hypothetical protein
MATAMYHTRKNPLRKIARDSETVETPRTAKIRRFHKALLRYHDPNNWETLRDGLRRMGRAELIGNGPQHLVPRSDTPAMMTRRTRSAETPAKRFGQKKLRPGAAIQRKRTP